MQFVIESEIFSRFPGIHIAVAVAYGLDSASDEPEIAARWREAWSGAAAGAVYGNAQSHPRVKPWRDRFQAQNISGKEFPSSIEAMLRRALKGGEPFTINPLVDFYNAISLRHLVPAGGFDLSEIDGPLELRLTRPGDTFVALDAEQQLAMQPGEVAYANGQTVLTRHFVWRQARTALISRATRDVFLVSEILGEVLAQDSTVADAVRADFQQGLRELFGVASQGFVLDAEHTAVAW
jgi:DNA/RNA-binding domain of Phe-tRNA-synthetase-like protein